jgi:hypothetical protein
VTGPVCAFQLRGFNDPRLELICAMPEDDIRQLLAYIAGAEPEVFDRAAKTMAGDLYAQVKEAVSGTEAYPERR